MKRKYAVLLSVMLMLTACKEKNSGSGEETETGTVSINMHFSNGDEPFEDYMVRVNGTNAKYILDISKSELKDQIKVTVEDSSYKRTVFYVDAPEGYIPYFPETQVNAPYAANIIRNDLTAETYPDLIQFSFVLEDKNSGMPDYMSAFYTIDDEAKLHKIEVTDMTSNDGSGKPVKLSFLDRAQFNHTEPGTFIYEISVDDTNIYDEEGAFIPVEERVKIKVLTFDKKDLTMKISRKVIAEYDPLYFGYAYWAVANAAAQYFTQYTLPDVDYQSFAVHEGSDEDYYLVDSDRFRSTEDLRKYLRSIFSRDMTDKLLSEAPQDYRDINGRLYAKDTADMKNSSLGTLTFTDYYMTETTMLFYSRQVKFDSDGNFEAYTDGGNFEISCENSDNWEIVRYRYPYS
ncbi:MAG: hypothetical protein ILP19_09670 [Oscillospiraceae bacterium]|nr:hypothetical protein [Oscillospiraceae bacterium]